MEVVEVMAVDVVVMSVFMVAVEGTAVLVVPMSGAMVSVTSSVDVSEMLAVIVVVSKLFPAVEEGRSCWLVTVVLATVDSGLDVSVSIMVVVGAGVSVLSMAVADVPATPVVAVSELLLLAASGQNCISVSRSVSQRYPESPATVTAAPASPLPLTLAYFRSSTKDSAASQLMHIVSSFGLRGRDLAVVGAVGSVETSGLAAGAGLVSNCSVAAKEGFDDEVMGSP